MGMRVGGFQGGRGSGRGDVRDEKRDTEGVWADGGDGRRRQGEAGWSWKQAVKTAWRDCMVEQSVSLGS